MKVKLVKKRTLFGKKKQVHIVLEDHQDLCTIWHLFNKNCRKLSEEIEEEGNPLKYAVDKTPWSAINELVKEAGLKSDQL